ncbi:MAG: MBL fold metallo-hydrolase [Myxococcales bacterium]|nr:MBL fold metallo-hydrolase [Myxococcales bacterium]
MPQRRNPIVAAALAELTGAEYVSPAVLRVPLPTPTLPPATHTNHYIVGSKTAVLVDPATPHRRSQQRLTDLARLWSAEVAPIKALLLTHHHADHIGAATVLAQRLQLPIWAHIETAKLLTGRVVISRHIEDGDVVASDPGGHWTALHTPGHAPGHLVLCGAGGGVIAGDMVAGEGTIVVDPKDGDMGQYLASLARLQTLDSKWLAPAHGAVLRDPAQILSHYISHRRGREAKVFGILSDAPQPENLLVTKAYDDVPRRIWPLALRSMRAHLLYLEQQGRVRRVRPHSWCRLPQA